MPLVPILESKSQNGT